MNIINDRDLALRFRNDAVPSRERFIYLVLCLLIFEILTSSFVMHLFYAEKYNIYSDIAMVALSIIGTIICYRTNKSGDDREFIERYVSIGFPISIQVFLIFAVFIVAVIVFYVLKAILKFEFDLADLTEAGGSVIGAGIMIYYYWRLNSSIKLAATAA